MRIIGHILKKVNTIGDSLLIIFLLGYFISVFVFWPYAEVSYELPKVWFVMRWIEFFSITSFLYVSKLSREKIDTKLVILVLSFLFVVLLTSVVGLDFKKSIAGNYYRMDGIITLLHLVILYFTVLLFFKKNWIFGFILVASVSTILLSVISILQWFANYFHIFNIYLWDGGYGHVFGNPNFLVGYLLLSLPLISYLVDRSQSNKLWLLGLTINVIGIILTNAWAGYFGILLFLMLWLIGNKRVNKLLVIVLSGLLLGVLSYRFLAFQTSLETPTSINPESRQRIIMKSYLSFINRPISGYGWANFDYAFKSVDYPIHMEQDVYVDKAHSSILEVGVTTGMFGLLIYLLIIAKSLVNIAQSREAYSKYLFMSYLLLIIHMQTNVISISEEITFWIMSAFFAKRI